ncbi:S-layer homology domain-containing protein [Gracilibacillus sp. YIM 98692]|uniref:S-layer homology domain-containing protein n=1 Tax=Gracilibacillus sp. YIM 98692 TaxID=2663532 RepID=UPI0013D820B7|nr:S-layer homology domain-containing protein [Gracilibacillus sp. YIM 98692]
MLKKIKLSSTFIVLSLILFILPTNFAYANEGNFKDVPNASSHFEGIDYLVNKGAINGYTLEDGSKEFKPGQSITRSQTTKLFVEALDLPIVNNAEEVLSNFKDVDKSHYYADYIATTYHEGIFKGSEGNFNEGYLSRSQMATVISRAFDLEDNGVNKGINLSNVSSSHKESVQLLAKHGITNQFDDFRPNEKVSRAQFATFLYRAISTTEDPVDDGTENETEAPIEDPIDENTNDGTDSSTEDPIDDNTNDDKDSSTEDPVEEYCTNNSDVTTSHYEYIGTFPLENLEYDSSYDRFVNTTIDYGVDATYSELDGAIKETLSTCDTVQLNNSIVYVYDNDLIVKWN